MELMSCPLGITIRLVRMRKIDLWIFFYTIALLLMGCGELEVPKPEYYEDWEQLNVDRIGWLEDCYLPTGVLLVDDTSTLKKYGCKMDLKMVDFSLFDALFYAGKPVENVVEMKAGSYLYINHYKEIVRLEVVTRYRDNRSGLSSNGFIARDQQVLIIPKIPSGYHVQITYH